jgi:hypothetical protein
MWCVSGVAEAASNLKLVERELDREMPMTQQRKDS